MPGLDLFQSILSGKASYTAGDWASASAFASLDGYLTGEFRRGMELELGAQALVQLDAAFSKFIAAEARASAHAAAKVKAQFQVPLDLFDEIGAAIRLQAKAEVAASVEFGIGLSMGDFIALAETDPRIRGVAARLLRVFLEELEVKGGVKGKVAYSAMAYANLAITGCLLPEGTKRPGFTIAGEMGVGLKGGAGWRAFVNCGVEDPRRLVRRSVDVVIDETLRRVAPLIPDAAIRAVLPSLRAPCKMALRSAFELGVTLAENPGTFDAGAAPRVAQRCLQVLLEEAQRFLLEQLVRLGLQFFNEALEQLGISQEDWDASKTQRAHFAAVLREMPDDPFEPSQANLGYWPRLVRACLDLGAKFAAQAGASETLTESISVFWAATQLLLVGVQRISTTEVRASMIGMPPAQVQAAFSGGLLQNATPPEDVATHINETLGRSAGTPLTQENLVAFLVRDVLLERLRTTFPAVEPVLDIMAGPQGIGAVAAAQALLTNLGAFVQDAGGAPDPQASLAALVQGLEAYISARVDTDLAPALYEAVSDHPDLRLYVDEVLLATLKFSVSTVLQRVVDWGAGDLDGQTALREACSSVVMKLFGRSLVVIADIIMARAMEQVGGKLEQAAARVDDPDGVAVLLAEHLPVDRAQIADVTRETLLIASEVFSPLPDPTRARIRALLYELVDTVPASPNADFVEQLRHASFIPNMAAAEEVAKELGAVLADTMQRFAGRCCSE